MLLRLHGEIKEAVGGGRQLLSLVFGLFSLHASLSDAMSVRSFAKSDPRALLEHEEENCIQWCLLIRPLWKAVLGDPGCIFCVEDAQDARDLLFRRSISALSLSHNRKVHTLAP